MASHASVMAFVPHFLIAPGIAAATDLVLTTGRRIAEPFAATLGEGSVARWQRSIVREATSRLRAAESGRPRRAS